MKRLLGSVASVVLAGMLFGCGGGVSGSGSVSGDAPYAFDVQSAFLVHYTNGDKTLPQVLLTNQSWSCDDLKSSGNSQPNAFVDIGLDNGSGQVTTGDFEISSQTTGPSAFFELNNGTNTLSATGGSVTVTELSDSHIKGTFQADDGTSHLTGAFDAPLCDTALGQ